MHAIEFHATINGDSIEIPPEHRTKLSGGATVIVMPDVVPAAGPNLIDQMLAQPRRVVGFKPLTRDDAHAR